MKKVSKNVRSRGGGGMRAQVVELEEAGDELENIQKEIQMLQAFDCPQLTRYYGSFIVGRWDFVKEERR